MFRTNESMARIVGKTGLALLGGFIVLVSAAFIGGRALRANAPEMVFIRGERDVYALDVERGFVKLLAQSDYDMNAPSWSPDGRYLTFTVIDGSGSSSIGRIDSNGKIEQLYREAAPIWSTAWSPDSDEVAFIAADRLFLMDADGQNARPLDTPVHSRSYSLSWSPDGEHVAFIGGGASADPYIYLLNVDGRDDAQRAVTRIPADPVARPSWSADSQQLAFISGTGVYIANSDGSGETQVAQTTIPRSSDWSPDGRLAFISDLQLYIAATDGDIQPLPTHLRVDRSPSWSPDGGRLAFVSGGDLYLIDPDGGEASLLTPDDDSRTITEFAWRR
jgi:Tol biopolymer transport system component